MNNKNACVYILISLHRIYENNAIFGPVFLINRIHVSLFFFVLFLMFRAADDHFTG